MAPCPGRASHASGGDHLGAGLETAIILTAFVVVATVFAEPGELKLVLILVADINPAPTILANSRWTLELQTPVGAVIDPTRSMPGEPAAVMQLL